jgi:biotin carboxyl carrier protein
MPEKTISSPLPGVFYRAPSPGEAPFVNEGDLVSHGDVIGLVEAMKSFHAITADVEGTIERFLLDDGDPVDVGQPIVDLSD